MFVCMCQQWDKKIKKKEPFCSCFMMFGLVITWHVVLLWTQGVGQNETDVPVAGVKICGTWSFPRRGSPATTATPARLARPATPATSKVPGACHEIREIREIRENHGTCRGHGHPELPVFQRHPHGRWSGNRANHENHDQPGQCCGTTSPKVVQKFQLRKNQHRRYGQRPFKDDAWECHRATQKGCGKEDAVMYHLSFHVIYQPVPKVRPDAHTHTQKHHCIARIYQRPRLEDLKRPEQRWSQFSSLENMERNG